MEQKWPSKHIGCQDPEEYSTGDSSLAEKKEAYTGIHEYE